MKIWPFNRFPANSLDVNLLQENLAKYLRQIEENPFLSGRLIEASLAPGPAATSIPHGLGRVPVGAIIVGQSRGILAVPQIGNATYRETDEVIWFWNSLVGGDPNNIVFWVF